MYICNKNNLNKNKKTDTYSLSTTTTTTRNINNLYKTTGMDYVSFGRHFYLKIKKKMLLINKMGPYVILLINNFIRQFILFCLIVHFFFFKSNISIYCVFILSACFFVYYILLLKIKQFLNLPIAGTTGR